MALPRIDIYDTTLRDGTQGEGFNLSLRDKLLVAERLDDFGVDYIEGGFPGSNPKDVAFFAEAARRRFRHAKLAAFGMTRRRGMRAEDDPQIQQLLAARTPVVTLVGKTSRWQVERVLAVSPDENLAMIGESVACVVRAGRECVYDAEHFFDGYRADPAYAIATLKAALQAGASVLVLCDTNGGTLPEDIAAAVAAVRQALPTARLGIHTHNDAGLAVAGALAAVRAGCTHAQGTINGVGERCGNMDLTTLIANLQLKLGAPCLHGGEGQLARLTELSRYVYDLSNTTPVGGQPYVGASAFAHKGGMHVHAIQKDTASYEHVDPARVGNVRKILISELSGASNIAATAGKKYGLENDKALLRQVLSRVCELENQGWAFEVAEASFDLLVRRLLGRYTPTFDLLHYRVEVIKQGDGEPVSEATVKLSVGSAVRHEVAEGDGPVAALDAALRKALLPSYPELKDLHLMDYKVRVVPTYSGDGSVDESKSETSSVVRVVAEFRREGGEAGDGYFGTVGVSANIVDASFLALRDAYDFHLLGEPADPARSKPTTNDPTVEPGPEGGRRP
ncbi:MAG: citramalate synthase [Tepidisphaerales bacterium]